MDSTIPNKLSNISHHLLDPYIAENIGSSYLQTLDYIYKILPALGNILDIVENSKNIINNIFNEIEKTQINSTIRSITHDQWITNSSLYNIIY